LFVVAALAKRPASYESEEDDDDDRYYGSYVESDSERGYTSSESSSSHRYYSSSSSTPSPSPSSPSLSATPGTNAVSKKVPIAKRRLARELVEEIVVTVPRKSVDGDSTFLKKLALFRRNLFEDGDRLEKIFDTVLQTGGDAHITTTPIAKWLPVEVCMIYGNNHNLILLVQSDAAAFAEGEGDPQWTEEHCV
jgi:hypothetical protein